jgi:serine protease Do
MTIGETAEQLRRSTVQIVEERGGGSGVILPPGNLVITNSHVLRGRDPRVELWDGRSSTAEILERDATQDLALLALPFATPGAIPLRTEAAAPGESVLAVGNPLGFTGALSKGVIRGMFGRFLHSSVRLAPGNSGGPLSDYRGGVVGINTMIARGGYALSIPAGTVSQFLRHGAAPRLGVTLHPVPNGLLLLTVEENSAADRAALMPGDILLGFKSPVDLSNAIAECAGGVLTLRFQRGGVARERQTTAMLERKARRRAA